MARARDGQKRQQILDQAKALFAVKGFASSSIAELVTQTGLPVGTLYTYFSGKDDMLSAIVEEGWQELAERLRAAVAGMDSTTGREDRRTRLDIIVEAFLPELFKDLDLIRIVLTETAAMTRLPEKLETLTQIIHPLLIDEGVVIDGTQDDPTGVRGMRAAISVFFLGILHAVKLSETVELGFDRDDVMRMVRNSIDAAFA